MDQQIIQYSFNFITMNVINNKVMTAEDKFIVMLTDRGMFESQAVEVMKIAKPNLDSIFGAYKLTWSMPYDDYPQVIYDVLFQDIKIVALKWIEDNVPLAWYKPNFLWGK